MQLSQLHPISFLFYKALEDILTNGRIWQKKCQREFPTDTCLCGPGFKRSQYGNTWSCVGKTQ